MKPGLRMAAAAAAPVPLALFVGCAHVPDVSLHYHLAQTRASFKVVRTVACDAQNRAIVANAVTPTVVHTADPASAYALNLTGLRGQFSDNDLKFDLTDDGRLKAVNTTSTGQGEAILKTVVSIASAVFGLDAVATVLPKECADIRKAGDGKPLTLTYEADVDLRANAAAGQPIRADTTSDHYAQALINAIGDVCAFVESTEPGRPPLASREPAGTPQLTARQPGSVKIKVVAGASKTPCGGSVIWADRLPAAQLGTLYTIPIPAPAAFGKQTFAAAFAESGALTSIQYASSTGAGQALNALGSAVAAAKGPTTEQKAAEVKAQADLIAEQQRLVQCLADSKNCK